MNDISRRDQAIEQLRIPPQSSEAEQAVLGGIMLAPSSLDRVADILDERDFYQRDHQLIYRAIKALSAKNKPYDAVTIGEWFEAGHMGEQVSSAYLIELSSNTPSAANIVAYAHIVREKSLLRDIIDLGTEIVGSAFNPDYREPDELLAEAETRIMALGEAEKRNLLQDGEQGLRRAVREMDRRRRLRYDELLGASTGLDEVDEMTMGLQDTDLIIVAARPSMGKTALAQLIRRACALQGKRPGMWSLEMSAEQLFMRDIAAVGRVDFGHVQRTARATPDEMQRIRDAVKKMQSWEWWLDDDAGLTADQLVTRIRRAKRQHDIGIAIIDYLQYIDITPHIRHGGNTNTAIQEVTRLLKRTAKQLRIPIVLLSQLNRAVEARADKRPMMSDLRESGAIEQDADVILMLHRQGYYEREWDRNDARHNIAEVIVAKARNGRTGASTVSWQGRYQLFGNLSASQIPANYSSDPNKANRGFEPQNRTGLVQPTSGEDED